MPPSPNSRAKSPGLRVKMSDLHIWVGLLMGWFLYAMFLTGTVSYFKEELSQWARPELPRQTHVPDPAAVAQRVTASLAALAPGSAQWSMRLPDGRNHAVNTFWRAEPSPATPRGFSEANFDPLTGHKLASRDTAGGEFFFRFHFQFHYLPALWGRWLAGLAAMFMLVAIVSGVITHKKIFIDFFTFRWGKGQRSWLDAHNALSVFGLPFHLMITYTGLVTLMAMYVPWGEQAGIQTAAEKKALSAQLSIFVPPGKPSGQPAALAPVDAMVRQAQAAWGPQHIGRITINQPGDAAARVAISRADTSRVSMSPQYMLFDGSTGKLLEAQGEVGAAAETRGVLYALHLGRFSDDWLRWLYFIVSLAGTAMVGTGLVMWTVKRRTRLADPNKPYFGFWLVERLNIAAIAGLSIAMAAFLWSNRLLPLGLPGRADWEIHAFFLVWLATLLHAMLRPARSAWVEQLCAAALLLGLLPLLNAMTTSRPLWASLAQGDWVFAGMDLALWSFAGLHACLAWRTLRHRGRTAAPRPARPPSSLPLDTAPCTR